MRLPTLIGLVAFFAHLSLLSVGGSNAVVPEMGHHAVAVEGWLTPAQFTEIFAISQAAPGPSNLIVALVGYKAAGLAGAIIAQLAMTLPAAFLMLAVARAWDASSTTLWHRAFEEALAPIAVGLIFASGLTIAEGAALSPIGIALAAICTLLFWRTKLNPLPVMALLGAAGAANLV